MGKRTGEKKKNRFRSVLLVFLTKNSGFLQENSRAKEKKARPQGNINKEYYNQFNLREEDINKERRGIALQGDRTSKDTDEDRRESTSIGQLRNEVEKQKEMLAALLVAMDKDWTLRALLQEVLYEKSRKPTEEVPGDVGEEEWTTHKQNIKEKTRRLQVEERKARERRVVDNIRREFWDKARRESRYFDI